MILFVIDSQLIPTKKSKEELQTGRFPSDYRGSNFVCNDRKTTWTNHLPADSRKIRRFYGIGYKTTLELHQNYNKSAILYKDWLGSFSTPFRRPRSVSSLGRRLPPSSHLPRPACRPPFPYPPPSAQGQSGSSAARCLELGRALLGLPRRRPKLGRGVARARPRVTLLPPLVPRPPIRGLSKTQPLGSRVPVRSTSDGGRRVGSISRKKTSHDAIFLIIFVIGMMVCKQFVQLWMFFSIVDLNELLTDL